MKKLLAVAALVALVLGCSTHKVTDPVASKPGAFGTPIDGDGDGGGDPGGGGQPDYLNIALSPESQIAHPGDIVPILIRETGDQLAPFSYGGETFPGGFNTWQAYVDYDTTKLVPAPLVPVEQNNACLMIGGCAGTNGVTACGSLTTFFTVGPGMSPYNPNPIPAGTVYILTSIACFHTFVNGPGDLWLLRFRVREGAVGITTIRVRDARFNNGIYYLPLPANAQATISIGGVY